MREPPRRILAALAVLSALAGCAERKASPPPARTAADVQADDEAAADILEHHRHHHHGGTLMLVAMSLDDLGLPPDEQARVARIQGDLLAKMRPSAEIEKALDVSLADGISTLAIDATKVGATLDALAASSAAAHASAANDLEELHALLTPPQRAALVDKLEAQWSLWKRANFGEQGPLASLSKQIGLWPAQVDRLRDEIASADSAAPLKQAEVEGHIHAFEDAFQSDHFDAKSLTSGGRVTAHLAGWGAARLATFCEAANPLLLPEQRDKLAALLREHAGHDDARAKE